MKTGKMAFSCGLVLVLVILSGTIRAEDLPYQVPPKAILDVVTAPKTPSGFINTAGGMMLLSTPVPYPPISDLAKPMLRLAGYRFDPTTNGPHHPTTWKNLVFRPIAGGKEVPVKLPSGVRPGNFSWNAAGTQIAFTNTTDNGIELWIADAATGDARQISGVVINDILWGRPFKWCPDPRYLLANTVPTGRGAPPAAPVAPIGPRVLEASGVKKAKSTYESRDVLKNEYDAQLFDYYTTSQLVLIDLETDKVTLIGKPGIIDNASVSPDGNYLLVTTLHRPYSYEVTARRFPKNVDVWTLAGDPVYSVARLPLADQVPIHGVRTGPQNISWWPLDGATIYWSEALDGGDWKNKVENRSKVMRISAPFKSEPEEVFKTEIRFAWMEALQESSLAWIWTYDEDRHWIKQIIADMDKTPVTLRVLWEGSWDDIYEDPGDPDMMRLPNSKWVVRFHEGSVFMTGSGGSKEGYRPFLDKMDIATGKKTRLFRSDRDHLEYYIDWTDVSKGQFLTRRQSQTEPRNYFIRTLAEPIESPVDKGEAEVASTLESVTNFGDPAPALREISKELVTYKRADGVELSFTLLLPPNYEKGKRYPTVLEAYPLDYTDKKMAGQVRNSSNTFISTWGADSRLYALAGYVVLQNTAIPIVGPSESAYDTYTDQLVASAKAAIDKAVELGVTDRDRVGVIGHSHGALMVANLLARSKLFKAGIARSGAYNKTLTMFGFQNERRTLWEGQNVYLDVSPLFFADKIEAPLLLIHGEIDRNPGTTPLQSERMFEAVRGVGGTVRLVMLPYEDHGYRSQESVLHVLYEMIRWFDLYVK